MGLVCFYGDIVSDGALHALFCVWEKFSGDVFSVGGCLDGVILFFPEFSVVVFRVRLAGCRKFYLLVI